MTDWLILHIPQIAVAACAAMGWLLALVAT
jgi:hypothetical protein